LESGGSAANLGAALVSKTHEGKGKGPNQDTSRGKGKGETRAAPPTIIMAMERASGPNRPENAALAGE